MCISRRELFKKSAFNRLEGPLPVGIIDSNQVLQTDLRGVVAQVADRVRQSVGSEVIFTFPSYLRRLPTHART